MEASRRLLRGPSRALGGAALAAALLLGAKPARAQLSVTEINPDKSTLDANDPDGATGGRVNGLARASDTVFYAASEWGGVYKSTDRGRTWSRLDRHLPTATWDVEVSPADMNRIIATSLYDGRVASLAGVNVSSDGGANWTHPSTAAPPVGFCRLASRRDEPSAFGIAFDQADPLRVYVGTSCGLAVSGDGGATWRYVDPTPANGANDVWDVAVHHGGVIDVCGDDGHRRSTDGAATWTTATAGGTPLPSGRCSIAASPDEPHVLFAVVGTSIFESDDGGGTWNTRFGNPSPQGRIPFVATNDRAGRSFDLWFGDTSLHRAACATPASPAPGGSPRCPPSATWAGGFTRDAGAHDDTGDVAFTSTVGEACPALLSSDGGVYRNMVAAAPACHTPAWEQPDVTPHGLWLFGLGGAHRLGNASEDLYFGCQDDGTFASRNAGAVSPSWTNKDCCDGFDAAAGPGQVAYTMCCFSPEPANRLFVRGGGMAGGGEVPNYPPGSLPGFAFPDVIDRFGTNSYVVITSTGVFVTTDITANPITWGQLGAATSPAGACGVRASGPAASPTFYVQAGNCSGSSADRVFRYAGIGGGGTWQPVDPPEAAPGEGFGVFTVHRSNPSRLFASHIRAAGPRMIRSSDGGANWSGDTVLDGLMSGAGVYRARTVRGPTDFTAFNGYVQPSLVAFDPAHAGTLLAGAVDAGVFLSRDGGTTWSSVTDNSGPPANPHIPRPRFAYFDRECGSFNIYVGTQGRGVWRIRYPDPDAAGLEPCLARCEEAREICLDEVGAGGPTAAQCVRVFTRCSNRCRDCPS